jgi:hypothetical protein
MGKNYASLFLVALTISALPLACGDDEEGGGGKGGGSSTGGSKATGGASGTGTGGKATGGTGTGGKATGGTGTGGKATGGTGTGGTTSTGGTTPGGAGGEGGAMGGEGGGGTEPTLCEAYCDAGEIAGCTHTTESCITTCEYTIQYGVDINPDCEQLFTDFYGCAIEKSNSASDWACNQNQPNYTATDCLNESMAVNDGYCFG